MQVSEIERLLPGVIQRTLEPGTPLSALLGLMSALHAPAEALLEDVETNFDPRRAPDRFVPFLAKWVNLDLTEEPPVGRLRELVALAFELSQWRGTARGLLRFLETATGLKGFAVEEQVTDAAGKLRPFHVRLHAPAAAWPFRALVEEIIEREKPAHVTYELTFDTEKERHHAARI